MSAPSGPATTGWEGVLQKYFRSHEMGSDARTEIMAGLTTFVVMSYIIFVNPSILNLPDGTGLPIEAVTTSTCLVAGVMTILMGVVSNKAYAIAPGLG